MGHFFPFQTQPLVHWVCTGLSGICGPCPHLYTGVVPRTLRKFVSLPLTVRGVARSSLRTEQPACRMGVGRGVENQRSLCLATGDSNISHHSVQRGQSPGPGGLSSLDKSERSRLWRNMERERRPGGGTRRGDVERQPGFSGLEKGVEQR